MVTHNAGGAMRFELLDVRTEPAGIATIRQISALGVHWRVVVEAYGGADGWSGRLVFEPRAAGTRHEARLGPYTLRGRTQAEILDAAHDIPERRLRELLHSLG